ncbi:MAG: hypothetical protein GX081_05875 [Firmicutes bacterium]|nr:hypothetical protein [Bacillota bacterium]
MKVVEAKGLPYRELNREVRRLLTAGEERLLLRGINGQRYIGAGLTGAARLEIEGTAGNNLGAMMDGLTVYVDGNVQDGAGNTMSGGEIIVRGSAGDITGYAMRGGKIFIQGNAGWRVGIHMKSREQSPAVLVIGGKAGDFLGEYMAGGTIVVLGLNTPLHQEREAANPLAGNYLASGMHGGAIYIRGRIPAWQIGGQVRSALTTPDKNAELKAWIAQFATGLNLDCSAFQRETFTCLTPEGNRPYARLYDHSA